MRIRVLLALLMAFVLSTGKGAAEKPSIEAYGNLPSVSHMAISPDGYTVAFILRKAGLNVLRIFNLRTNEATTVGMNNLKAGNVDTRTAPQALQPRFCPEFNSVATKKA